MLNIKYLPMQMILINGNKDVINLASTVSEFGVISAARVNWEKSDALIKGKWKNGLPILPGGLNWKRGGLKYLGVYLGDESVQQKNWDGIIEKMEGRLKKWKWIHSQLSFRGRVLILNNLIASNMWHKLSCVEPPTGLLSRLQTILVDFFWDRLHWVPQSVLFLPVEEGGQGLVSLSSRYATFRFQFIQKFLTGSVDVIWRAVVKDILHRVDGLGLDTALFLTDTKKLQLSGLSSFYRGLFKVWGSFIIKRPENATSLFWLLEEPLVKGARLDITDQVPNLFQRLCDTQTVKLGHMIKVAGSELKDIVAVASLLGQKSMRQTSTILELWRNKLAAEELTLLKSFEAGNLLPDMRDPFPKHWITPDLKEMSGTLLNLNGLQNLLLEELSGKVIYKCSVKIMHKSTLCEKSDNVWREKFDIGNEVKPFWRVLYKPPLMKKSGDLQWRILKGAVAVNAFVSVINSNVNEGCVFCGLRETIFHCFLECSRLKSLFALLKQLFIGFKETFTPKAFIYGAGYNRNQRFKWQLINFMVGQAKMAMYISRRNRINNIHGQDGELLFKAFIRSRISVEFKYYKEMHDLDTFVLQWCFNEVFCTVFEGDLIFSFLLC